jgi:hypothetical protein
MTRKPISRHAWDHLPGGQDAAWNDPWIFIGTAGTDGPTGYMDSNPLPFNPNLTPYFPIPFQNGFTNYLNGFSPVCFMVTVENYLEIHGPITGGGIDEIVFTLPDLDALAVAAGYTPVGTAAAPAFWAPTNNGTLGNMGTYWPLSPKVMTGALVDGSGTFTYSVDTSGNVTYLNQGAY